MSRTFSRAALSVAFVLVCGQAAAVTFVVPNDREMVRRADAIVVASALNSYTQLTPRGGIETVTSLSVEEVLKGTPDQMLEVHEPGGLFGDRAMIIPGIPRFVPGQRTIVFLSKTPQQTWAVTELVLGKFTLATDVAGRHLAIRDEGDINGWDPAGRPWVEKRRAVEPFLDFLRAEGRGAPGVENYFVTGRSMLFHADAAPALGPTRSAPSSTAVNATAVTAQAVAPAGIFTGRSYTSDAGSGNGARWTVFPGAVTFFNENTEPGAPGGGVTAVQSGLAAWTNDCGSDVNYVYGGADSTHTSGLAGPDGLNTVIFERNLTAYGAGPFTCTATSYGGTLGIGGVTATAGTHVLNGETYFTTTEGDVEMNQGVANCTLLFGNGDWNSAVAHELGHTLGFRHSDQTRANNPSVPCSTDPTLECSSSAIMTASVTHNINATLQPWDIDAVRAVYPGGTCGVVCVAPVIAVQPQSPTINAGTSATLTVTATGTAPLSYQWYIGTTGNTVSPIAGATGPSVTVAPSATTSYWVRVSNACGTADSATATVTVTGAPPPPVTHGTATNHDFDGDGRADVVWFNSATGQISIWFMNGPTRVIGISGSASAGWTPVAIGDFNGDGRNDLFWRHTNGDTAVWLMSGASVITRASLPSVPDLNWVPQGTADFDGNGTADIFWRNTATGENAIWFMNGTTRTVGSLPTVPTQWDPQVFGDFNRDGKADVFWRNRVTGETAVWLMNGATRTANTAMPQVADLNWVPQGGGDFNNDGATDVFWRNTATGEDSLWLMDGASRTATSLPTVPAAWRPRTFGDFDINGSADVFWRDQSGNTAVWLMAGGAVATNAGMPSVTDLNWQPVTTK